MRQLCFAQVLGNVLAKGTRIAGSHRVYHLPHLPEAAGLLEDETA